MLQKLNERIQGIVAWVIVILIAVTFAFFGVDYYIQSRHDAEILAEVNGEAISKREFELVYQRTRQFRDASQINPSQEQRFKRQVMNEMIINLVSLQAAKKYGFHVSGEQANAAILNIPQFQEDGHFSSARYQQALSGALFTPETFQKEVRQGMVLNQQRFAFIGTAFALPSEVERFIKLYMQTRDYVYWLIPAANFASGVKIADREISEYYQQHQKEFVSPEQVVVDYVRLSMADIKKKISLSEEQIQSYYEENRSNYLLPAKWKVAHILFAIPSGASREEIEQIQIRAEKAYGELQADPNQFETMAKQYSDDKLSALQNGILPWIVAGQSDMDKALINLTQPGQISPPIKTRHGYQIFKLIAYKPAETKPFSQVKEDIRGQLQSELAQAKYAQLMEDLSDLSYQSPDSLEPVARALDLKVESTKPFSRQGGQPPLADNQKFIRAAFSHDVLELGNNSEPIQVDDDSVVVLRVQKHIPASQLPLAEVSSKIADLLAKQKAERKALQIGQELLQANEAKRQNIIEKYNLKTQEVASAGRESDEAPALINQLAFALPNPGASKGGRLENGDYAVVELKKMNDGDPAKLDNEQIANITQQLEASYGVMAYDLYVNQLMRDAKINHSPS
ncbi:SurA N-terminal domain-containing protein [Legionella londiniensis]|uniref:Periplasmic chaperone PpiD n=1 Tax=Legionella londiniensis TaxID=45068 RepID=A0A0W0VRG2_9GAMM|nr:SurA N-terminal domain-containing protein [Legionella londiniensis]KTD22623.1 peptidyl-prolyl cis-trans isomerase D [Legionella londiniensis]STX92553.1 peptidyl-prolyl cis-trans isomerase D [Legionella londiniensis]